MTTSNTATIRRGDIYYIRECAAEGSEQKGARPGIIVSNDKCNEYSDVVEVVYLTTKHKKQLVTHVSITGRDRKSTAFEIFTTKTVR